MFFSFRGASPPDFLTRGSNHNPTPLIGSHRALAIAPPQAEFLDLPHAHAHRLYLGKHGKLA